jgi:hypothetical protein
MDLRLIASAVRVHSAAASTSPLRTEVTARNEAGFACTHGAFIGAVCSLREADYLTCVFTSSLIVANQPVAIHCVEVPLRRVDDEVVFWPRRVFVLGEQAESVIESALYCRLVSHAGPATPRGVVRYLSPDQVSERPVRLRLGPPRWAAELGFQVIDLILAMLPQGPAVMIGRPPPPAAPKSDHP